MLALLGGKAEPARAIAEVIPRRADAPEIEPGQIICASALPKYDAA